MRRFAALLAVALLAGPALAEKVWNDPLHKVDPVLNTEATVSGPDKNANGVRDDIDAFVLTVPYADNEKAALLQMSRALQTAMTVDLKNDILRQGAATGLANAAACMHARYASMQASQMNRDVQKMTVNTPARVEAYGAFNKAMSGFKLRLPAGDGCTS